jgi:tetratricopeptide (TPR) repeat protein
MLQPILPHSWTLPLLAMLGGTLLLLGASGCRPGGDAVADPAARIGEGWQEYRMGEYNRAAAIFTEVADGVPTDSPDRLRALYGLGCTHWLKLPTPDKPRAQKIFREIQQLAPESEYAAWSELALIRIDHIVPVGETPDYPAIRQRYEALYQKSPTLMPGQEGFIYMVGTLIASMKKPQLQEALRRLDEFLRLHPDSPFVSSAWGLRGRACKLLGLRQEMLDAGIKALETIELDPTNPYMENSGRYWGIATTAEFEVGDFALAREYYQRLIDEYPRDRRRFGALEAMQRMAALTAQFDAEDAP